MGKVPAQGPHGRVLFDLPEGCKPGTKQQFRLRPGADLRVEVPKDLKEGMSMTFEREDGTRISMTVPNGKVSGDTFEVIPPAAMVLVPEEAQASSMWPADIEVQVPDGWTEGEKVPAQVPASIGKEASFASPCRARQASSGSPRLFRGSSSLVSTSLLACRLPTALLVTRARSCLLPRQHQRRRRRDIRRLMRALLAVRIAMLCKGGLVPVPVDSLRSLGTHLSRPSPNL